MKYSITLHSSKGDIIIQKSAGSRYHTLMNALDEAKSVLNDEIDYLTDEQLEDWKTTIITLVR